MKWSEIILERILLRLSSWLSTAEFESLTYHMVLHRSQALPPMESLRMLFRLDGKFYSLQGKKAVEHGGGVHPKHRLMKYHGFFANRIREGEKVLDIGCGIGAVAYDVAEESGAWVVGIDLDESNVNEARQRFSHPRVEYRIGDASQGLPHGPFDVVILSNVLEHLPHRSAFLARIRQEVRPAKFLIRVPHFERDWRVPLKKELDVEWRLDPTHETEYSSDSFADEMVEAGLKITHFESRWGEIWAEVVPEERRQAIHS